MGTKRWIVWRSGCLTAALLSITPRTLTSDLTETMSINAWVEQE